jgi:hypothetical protein
MFSKLIALTIAVWMLLSGYSERADAKSNNARKVRTQGESAVPVQPAGTVPSAGVSPTDLQLSPAEAYSQGDGYLRSNVIFNDQGSNYRLSRQGAPKQTGGSGLPPATGAPPAVPPSSKLQSQTPIGDMSAAQQLLQQSLDATFYACDYLILTGVNSRQLSAQEELELRTEMDGIAALNKSYVVKGYTKDTFNEIQRKLVILQLHIYTYGQNAITR